jgi:hypothetical protein
MGKDLEVLVVRSKVKAYVTDNGFRTSETFIIKLNEEVYRLINRAINRAASANRGTLKERDA